MRFSFTILTTLLVAFTAHAVPQGQPSSTSCFNCPPTDEAGFPLGNSDTTSNPIFCSYPAFSGENPNDFFCTYNPTTGVLVTDNDAGFCPGTAVAVSCVARRRRGNPLPRAPQPAAPVARDVKATLMKTRTELGARKRKA
jgi:hypothetical protein